MYSDKPRSNNSKFTKNNPRSDKGYYTNSSNNRYRNKYQEEEFVRKKKNFNQKNDQVHYLKKEESNDSTENQNLPVDQQFIKEKYLCLVCLVPIKKRESLWGCKQCFIYLHLSCLHTWIKNSAANKNPSNQLYVWNCMHCNYFYSESMPCDTCFCGKVKNPERDPYLTPHSCGKVCGRKRGTNCTHSCTNVCHPGPCEPCHLMERVISCYCSKKSTQVKCSDNFQEYSCGELCNKLLPCKKHHCQLQCHQGVCPGCKVEEEFNCFCGKNKKMSFCGTKGYSCGNKCGKGLSCGNHVCELMCHEGECRACPLLPSNTQLCPCGKTLSKNIPNSVERRSCLDPIATCNKICNKLLTCQEHYCKNICHVGPCQSCEEIIEKECKCENEVFEIQCNKKVEELLCSKVCKKKKSCKLHKCDRICCSIKPGIPDPQGYHLCLKICGKQLNCGKHTCELFCHGKTPCQDCPLQSNLPLYCGCGKKYKKPPIRCGTSPPDCMERCNKILPCQHLCQATCHYEDCPPCSESVEKLCVCGLNVVAGRCSGSIYCKSKCKKKLVCGHNCNTACHEVGKCREVKEGCCDQICKKQRKNCSHNCMELCHEGKECPDVPCKVNVKAICECGRREAFVPCNTTTEPILHSLKCDEVCKNKARFGKLLEKNNTKFYYPATLLKFCKSNLQFIEKLEDKIDNMILNGKDFLEIVLTKKDDAKRLCVQILVSRHYLMNLEYWNSGSTINLVIKPKEDSKIPSPKLSSYYKAVQKGTIKLEVLPFDVTLIFNLANTDQPETIDGIILREYAGKFYIERLERTLLLHIWEKDDMEGICKKLNKAGWSKYYVDENSKLMLERKEIEEAKQDVVTTIIEDKSKTECVGIVNDSNVLDANADQIENKHSKDILIEKFINIEEKKETEMEENKIETNENTNTLENNTNPEVLVKKSPEQIEKNLEIIADEETTKNIENAPVQIIENTNQQQIFIISQSNQQINVNFVF